MTRNCLEFFFHSDEPKVLNLFCPTSSLKSLTCFLWSVKIVNDGGLINLYLTDNISQERFLLISVWQCFQAIIMSLLFWTYMFISISYVDRSKDLREMAYSYDRFPFPGVCVHVHLHNGIHAIYLFDLIYMIWSHMLFDHLCIINFVLTV